MVRGFAFLLIAAVIGAQTRAPASAFEVASVKPRAMPRGHYYFPLATPSRIIVSGTRVTTQGPLFHLVAAAYGVQFYQIAAASDWPEKWAAKESYEIEARAPGELRPTRSDVRAMLQTLLAERFDLKMHRESRVMPVYNLLVGPGGPKIKPSKSTEPSKMEGEGSFGSQIRTRYTNFSIADFITQVMSQFDRPLVDRTALTGEFDFALEYSSQLPGMTSKTAEAMGLPDPDPGLPIASSIRTQLGLRVVASQGPVEMLIIDHAEKPTSN